MNSFLKSTFFNFSSQFLSFLSGFILSVLLARYLGAGGMGQLSFLIQLSLTIALIFTLGVPKVLTRYIASFLKQGESSLVSILITKVFIGELIVSVIATVLLLVSFKVFFDLKNETFYLLAILTIPPLALNNIINGILQGFQKYEAIFKINFFISLLNLILTMGLILLKFKLDGILALNLLIQVLTFLFSAHYIKKYLKLKTGKLERGVFIDISKYSLSTSAIVVLDLILMERSEIFFLKIFSQVEQIAFYSIAFGVVSKIMILIPGSISGVLMPAVAAQIGASSQKAIEASFYKVTRYLIFITFPIILCGLIFAELFVSLVYGFEYLPMVSVLKLLFISGGLSAIVAGASSVIYGIGKQSVILKIAILAVAVNLVLDLLLIPKYGAVGAAFANGTAQLVGVIIGIYYITYIKQMPFPWLGGFQVLLSGIVASCFTLVARGYIIFPPFLSLIFLSLVFISFYLLQLKFYKFFNDSDLQVLKEIMSLMRSKKL